MEAVHRFGQLCIAVTAMTLWAFAARPRAGFPDYKPLPADQYASYQEQQGIGVAVFPIFDKALRQSYFGRDVVALGRLPVYLVIENRTSPWNVILLRDKVLYEGRQQARPEVSGAPISIGGVQAMIAQSFAGMSPFLRDAATLSLLPFAEAELRKLGDVRMNLLAKEIRTQTVVPGKAGGGFLYLPTSENGVPSKEGLLDVPVQGSASGALIHFYFRIDMRPSEK